MSEMLAQGPLDLVRAMNDVANGYDIEADHMMSGSLEEQTAFRQKVFDLDLGNPIMREEVVVYGTVITFSVDENMGLGVMVFPPEEQPFRPATPIRGKYNGFTVCRIYNPVNNRLCYRVTHMVEEGVDKYLDEFGNGRAIIRNAYICAYGSEVVPLLPRNSHSFQDLRDDKVVKYGFEEVVFAQSAPRIEMIKKLGSIAGEAMTRLEHEDEMNRQRISYLNSLGLLENTIIFARDYKYVLGSNYEIGDEIAFSNTEQETPIKPELFVVAPGYNRPDQSTVEPDWGRSELYIQTNLGAGKSIMVPTKNITDLKEIRYS